jgi:hypothetical protein
MGSLSGAGHFSGSGIMKRIILSSIMIFLLFSCEKTKVVETQTVTEGTTTTETIEMYCLC